MASNPGNRKAKMINIIDLFFQVPQRVIHHARNLPPLLQECLLRRGEAGPRQELAQALLRLW